MPVKTETRKPFNCLLSTQEDDMLTQLSAIDGISKGNALRNCLRTVFAMRCKAIPTCADGGACFVLDRENVDRHTAGELVVCQCAHRVTQSP
jgi:hypothetical protein